MMPPASREVAVVTGASRGIGRLLSRHLAAAGVTVVAVARQSEDLDSLVSEGDAGSLVAVPADVTDPAAVAATFSTAEQLGPVTMAFTCAGSIDALGPIVEADPERWWSAVTVDLRGTMLVAQAAARHMASHRRGLIVTVYGNLGDRGEPNVSAFASAKAGIVRFTEILAAELSGTGVTALCAHPGFVRTPMTEHLASSEEGRRALPGFARHASRHWGDGTAFLTLVDQLVRRTPNELAGRTLYAGDDIGALVTRTSGEIDLRHLRIVR